MDSGLHLTFSLHLMQNYQITLPLIMMKQWQISAARLTTQKWYKFSSENSTFEFCSSGRQKSVNYNIVNKKYH